MPDVVKVCSVVILLLCLQLFIACTVENSQSTANEYHFPAFDAVNLQGENFSSAQFRKGTTIVILGGRDQPFYTKIMSWIDRIESDYEATFNKLCLLTGDQTPDAGDWILSKDPRAIQYFKTTEEDLVYSRVYIFHNDVMSYGDYSYNTGLNYLAFELYGDKSKVTSVKDHIFANDPNKYLKPEKIYQFFAAKAPLSTSNVALVLSKFNTSCNSENLLSWVDKYQLKSGSISSLIILDQSFSDKDAELLMKNMQLSIPVVVMDDDLSEQIRQLDSSNFYTPTNLVFNFDIQGELIFSEYILEDCSNIMGAF